VVADAPPVKIGFIFSYTGASAQTAKYADAAIDAYVQQHGDTVAGRKVVIIKRDDTGIAPEVARRLAQELVIQEHVEFLAGALLTPNAVAIEQVSSAAHVPFLIVNAGTSGILAKQPYTVRFGFTNAQITQPLDSKLNRAFVEQFRKSYGGDRQPNYVAVAVYDVLNSIYRTVAAQKGELDPAKSLDVLRNMSFESPRGPIRIDPKTRDIVQNVYIWRIERSGSGWAYRQIAVLPMVRDVTEGADQ
jgi:ABC-type branched-subunit amino acid transport system substrate-binding protein